MKFATARAPRVDWPALRARVDIIDAATRLFGRPPDARRGRVAYWRCPWHDDHDPSLVADPERGRWRCWPCGIGGDAADLVMRLEGVGFLGAAEFLTGTSAPSGKAPGVPVAKPAPKPPAKPTGLAESDAMAMVETAAARLWSPGGAAALAYLRTARFLEDETIRAARLGWVDSVAVPTRDGERTYRALGLTIPWFDRGGLSLVKIRQPEGRRPKYVEAFRDPSRVLVYPSPETIRPGRPLVIVEGEFDALLVGQALRGRAPVVTLGSASAHPEGAILGTMLAASPWYTAHDNDPAGDKAASAWPPRARRVRPPGHYKDWGEVVSAGVDLARWWADILGGTTNPRLFTWEELASWRWGGSTDADVNIDRHPPERQERGMR